MLDEFQISLWSKLEFPADFEAAQRKKSIEVNVREYRKREKERELLAPILAALECKPPIF